MLPAVALALKEVVSWLPLLPEKSANIILKLPTGLSLAELSSVLNNFLFCFNLHPLLFFYIIFVYLVFVGLHFKFLFVNSLP